MVNDVIADFLSRIRNAQQRKKETVEVQNTKMLESLAKILKDEGFVNNYEIKEYGSQRILSIELKYGVNGRPAISELKRVSKPGVRRYRGYKELKPVMNGLGISILSTPKGVMTGKQAIALKVGGEYICDIW